MKKLTPLQAAEQRLRAAEAEVQAARQERDALTANAGLTKRHQAEPAPYTHELKISEKQVWVLVDALEFYCRWCMGHFVLPSAVEFRTLPLRDYAGRALPGGGTPAVKYPEMLRAKLDQVRALLFPEYTSPGQHGGVGWNDNANQQQMQMAYELRKSLTAERNHRLGISNVDSGPWLHYSDQPLPVVRVLDPTLGVAEWQQFMDELKIKYPTTGPGF